ncbi:MAG: alanine--tRNA ligase [Dehalococcoidia bacterium]|nr:alanine--tRNA ligase [Dehalococcoidia bacterium]
MNQENWTSERVRETFLSYFESQDHSRMASASLIPVGDPTLLFTSAGMVQFKHYFTGEADPPNKRLTTSQKCFRTPDIEEVGDATHNTLFEMLGNFSIGDYFKERAVDFAVELMTEGYGIPLEKFAAAVHETDDETRELWVNKGIPRELVYSYGDDENWWGPAGAEGPCGPCSELHYDYGPENGCGADDCIPNCKEYKDNGEACDRYVELWNLVFMQFYHHLDGSRTNLPAPSVDTGMGFERLVRILQDVDTGYETDLFTPIISKVEEISGHRYGDDTESTYAIRVVAEHGRSVSFLVADGVVPGNEGRGYVLRRVIRRAIRYARRLGIEGNFLGEIADATIEKMGDLYPELVNNREFIHTVLGLEEDRFQQAFQNGYSLLTQELEGATTLPGEVVFRLWDTHGFPVEMTSEIASEQGVEVDMEGFERAMAAQREQSRAGAQFGDDRAKIRVYESLGVGGTAFLGYETLNASSVVVGLIADDEVVASVSEGQDVEVVMVATPFYSEGGGQIGDAGEIAGAEGSIRVHDTQEVMPGLTVHFGKVAQGSVGIGETVDAYVDPIRREDTARNHTATHLLHAALRQVLGPHVRQAGSLVSPDRLRFDFTHVQQVTDDEMWQVQLLVNEKIRQNARVLRDEDTYQEAIRRGALAFFGDRYDERVRLVEIANGETFSFEVCGGTHVGQTGEVGAVYVLGESSIGAGMRRIEAVSGRAAERMVWDRFHREERVARTLQTSTQEVEARVRALMEENDSLQREREAMERRLSLQSAEALLDSVQDVGGVKVLSVRATAANADSLREMGDYLRDKMRSGVVVLGSVINDRPMLVSMVTSDLVSDKGLNAADIARTAARAIGGGGGGRPEVAQAGGRDASKLDDALALVPGIVSESAAE